MPYPNPFLKSFGSIFSSILREKSLRPEQLELWVIDEESNEYSMFEPADVRDVLEQLADEINFLGIYTDRPAYFEEFKETMYEENGLIVTLFPKRQLRCIKAGTAPKLVLDFEWEGGCYEKQICRKAYYIPIHKKPWKIGENLDIAVPISYNTVIVKNVPDRRKKPHRDRFEAAFYGS